MIALSTTVPFLITVLSIIIESLTIAPSSITTLALITELDTLPCISHPLPMIHLSTDASLATYCGGNELLLVYIFQNSSYKLNSGTISINSILASQYDCNVPTSFQ